MSITLNANAMRKTAAKIKRPTRTAAVAHAGVCESVVIATPRSSLFAGTVAQPNVDVCLAHHLRPNVRVVPRCRRRNAPQTQASDTNALLGCRALLSHVLAQSTVNSFGSREELVQIWIDQHNVRAFAVTLGVLSANAGLD